MIGKFTEEDHERAYLMVVKDFTVTHSIPTNKILILLSDAAPYMWSSLITSKMHRPTWMCIIKLEDTYSMAEEFKTDTENNIEQIRTMLFF